MKRGTVRKFKRDHSQRTALLKSLATGLIEHGKIETTHAKARELRPYAEKLVTRARSGTLASRRLLREQLSARAVAKLMGEIAPRFTDRPGGYTRITKMGQRRTDGAPMAVIEFVA
jgi:large subunit ribosomal protein L17